MFEKYFAPGVKIELHPIYRATAKEQDNSKIYLSKVNQILEDNKIELMMPMEQSRYVLLPKDAIYNMITYSAHGLYQCNVKVGNRYKNGNVYIQIVEIVTSVNRYQRREFYRYDCSLPVYCRHLSPEERETMSWDQEVRGIECTAIDLGGGGIRFLTTAVFDKEVPVVCIIPLEIKGQIKEIQAMGKILSITPVKENRENREVRVQFEKISNSAREEIIQFIFEDERKRRSKNNGL